MSRRKIALMVAEDLFQMPATPERFWPADVARTWAEVKPGERMIYWRDTGAVIPGSGPTHTLYRKIMALANTWDARLHIQRVFDVACHVAIKRS